MSLENTVINPFIGGTVHFQADGEKYVGVLKDADHTHFIISPYQQVSKNQTEVEAAKYLVEERPPYWRCSPTQYGENMVIPITTVLYFIDSEQPKK